MTVIQAIEIMKNNGVKKLSGMYGMDSAPIEKYEIHARETHNNAVRYAVEGIKCWKYTLDHENDYELVKINGHYCIISVLPDGVRMALYGDFENEEEMKKAFDEWETETEAMRIAKKKAKGKSDVTAWYFVALKMIREAKAEAKKAFYLQFGQ